MEGFAQEGGQPPVGSGGGETPGGPGGSWSIQGPRQEARGDNLDWVVGPSLAILCWREKIDRRNFPFSRQVSTLL